MTSFWKSLSFAFCWIFSRFVIISLRRGSFCLSPVASSAWEENDVFRFCFRDHFDLIDFIYWAVQTRRRKTVLEQKLDWPGPQDFSRKMPRHDRVRIIRQTETMVIASGIL